jgi:hypothetical protein
MSTIRASRKPSRSNTSLAALTSRALVSAPFLERGTVVKATAGVARPLPPLRFAVDRAFGAFIAFPDRNAAGFRLTRDAARAQQRVDGLGAKVADPGFDGVHLRGVKTRVP